MVERLPQASFPETSVSRMRLALQVQGVVQGVGFRPFVHRLATQFGLDGFVLNDNAGVSIEVEGSETDVSAFQDALTVQSPPMSRIERVTATTLSPKGARGFTILHSHTASDAHTLVSPDVAICDECLQELLDPNNRRYRYPFINCTNCGPRYTIIRDLPYDRPLTTMADFHLCPACQREYDDPTNRRFHAQPNACPHCGPQLEFRWLCKRLTSPLARRFTPTVAASMGETALQVTQQLLAHGGIVGIKGIGGYHLACDATNDNAVTTLRQRKARGDKPFAIMARDLGSVLQIAHANAAEIALLASPERPIVLLKKRTNNRLSSQIAPGNPYIGVMLPYSPLHYLLFAPSALEAQPQAITLEVAPWLVMTSGNHADEPIITDDHVALAELGDLADALLLHNRPIYTPCDDSVVRVYDKQVMPIRRSRGYAPMPITLPHAVPPILAVGGEIKNAFCLAHGEHAFMSQHLGDMQNLETLQSFSRAVDHMQTLFCTQPQIIACDLHPGYLSTHWAFDWVNDHAATAQIVYVQHHHAHIAALMAEHGLQGDRPVIGFCFDGTGFGPDGAIWGGEVLVADYRHYDRVTHLRYSPLPGGDTTIHRPYRMALASLWSAGIEWDELLPPVMATTQIERNVLQRQLETGLNCAHTSSMGRLFDAVASLIGVRHFATYEAQAAIELEAVAGISQGCYHFALPTGDAPSIDATHLLQEIVSDLCNQVAPATIASRFHKAVANLIVEQSIALRHQTGLNQVALTGGVFQNRLLLEQSVNLLKNAHFDVLIHRSVPPNDGGLALGQAMVAAHQVAANKEFTLCA